MFVNIGFGNFINSSQIVSICRADSAPMKRMVSEARSKGSAVDATQGEKQNQSFLLEAVIWFSQRSHQRRLPPDVI